MSCSGGCDPECHIHLVHCYLSAQLTNFRFMILSLYMLSILGLYEMHFANIMLPIACLETYPLMYV